MWQRLISSGGLFQLYLIGFLILALVGLGAALKFSQAEVAIKVGKIETLTLAQAVLHSDLDAIARKVEEIEAEKLRLRLEAEQVSKLNQQNAEAKVAIETAFRQQRRLLDEIRGSPNEAIKMWANTPMPVDVVVLLKQAAYCAHPDHQSDEICISASRNDERMLTAPFPFPP
ncbi:hypothetical protein CXF83_15010 [Shewanella sp. Choline-02u-19]|uniref:hypothetical protein n=1 Tax=unclassified Shewanella TaxID=196818 RepID=UPI000C32664F|nr:MULTISPECIES: hypothetical protein [unclassified Shewanella]PKH62562.1 hypothetical protein CXF84_00920 [Shewanella sp. Bg11-22]PKI27927.1 hypothetical protein CXF83_15010 [Shewanella sp. Choline-02u-19]